jgi:GT2 family glycosyltransferase
MTLSIITICYNTPELVLECINSIREQFKHEIESSLLEVIVVDNASREEVVNELEKKLKEVDGVVLVKSDKNLGFGGGNNLGVKKAKGDYLLFLNSDTQVQDRGFLEMIDFAKGKKDVGILGGRLLNFDGGVQKSVGKFFDLFNLAIYLFGGAKLGLIYSAPEKVGKVDWLSGACMLIKKDLFMDIGQFDENMFMYVEDMEICYRVRKKGLMTYYYPGALVKHKEQGSSNRSFAVVNIYKGIVYFYEKHKTSRELGMAKTLLKIKALAVYLLGRISNNSYYTKTYGEALEVLK